MAIYHLHMQTIGRDKGRSAVAAAAYRAACVLTGMVIDRETGVSQAITFDYSQKGNVLHSEIMAPVHSPAWVYDRQSLWATVESVSIRKDARFAREIDVAIPIEFDKEQAITFMRDFVQTTFVEKGMVADYSIHWEQGNPHAHVMLTTRDITPEGLGKVNESWNRKEFLLYVRERCRDVANLHLERYGYEDRIDHRSYKDQAIALTPTVHEGVAARELLAEGIVTEVIETNRAIRDQNQQLIEAYPDTIIDLLAARRASFTEADIAREIFKRVEGDEASFQYVFDKVRYSKRLSKLPHKDVNGNERFAETRYVTAENALWNGVRELKERTGHSIAAAKSSALSDEQQGAANPIMEGGDISILIGKAGTGKTTLLRTLAEQYRQQGYTVKGGAISGIATENLVREAGIPSRTLASWQLLWQQQGGKLSSKDVFFIDEASMIDTVQMQRCVQAVSDAGAKLILVGDHDQIQPIGPGEAFRGIASQVGAAEITTVWRQKELWQRQATEQIAKGEIRQALSLYQAQGGLSWQGTRNEAVTGLVGQYLKDITLSPNKSRIILAYTNQEIERINRLVRADMKEAGLLGAEQEVRTAYGKIALSIGEKIVFLKNDRKLGVQNGAMATVCRIQGEIIEVQLEGRAGQGGRLEFSTQEYNAFGYGYAVTTHKAQGVTVDTSYLLLEKHFNLNTAYVGMSRHRESLNLFADHETYSDEKALVTALERRPENSLVSDYILTPKNQGYHQNVESYKEKTLQAAKLYQEIHNWAVKENSPLPEHEEWETFLSCKQERDALAHTICAEPGEHRIFLRQAHIRPGTVETHAGLRTPALSQEQKEARGLVQAYSRAGKEEAPLMADIISHNMPRYGRYLAEARVKEEQLCHHAEAFASQAVAKHQAGEGLNLPEQWAVYKSLDEIAKPQAAAVLHGAIRNALEDHGHLLELEQQHKKEAALQQERVGQAEYQEFLAGEKLGRVYRDGKRALEAWSALNQQHGIERAAEMVQENPALLGKLQGRSLLGIITSNDRKRASGLSLSLHSQLQKLETARQEKEVALHALQQYQESQRAILTREKITALEQHLGWIKDHERVVITSLENVLMKEHREAGNKVETKENSVELEAPQKEYKALESEELAYLALTEGIASAKAILEQAESMKDHYKGQAAAHYGAAENAIHTTFKEPSAVIAAIQAGEWEVASHLMSAAKYKSGIIPLSAAEKERRLLAVYKAIEPYKKARNMMLDNEKSITACTATMRDYTERLIVFEKTARSHEVRRESMQQLEQQIKAMKKNLGKKLKK